MSSKHPIKVKYAGKDIAFESLELALNELSLSYCGKSVSLIYPSQSLNMNKILFIDIMSDGTLRKSYGNCEPVCINSLKNDLAA